MELGLQAMLSLAAYALTAAFLLDRNPYLLALFCFVAQPLFLLAGLLYLRKVWRELREREVL